MNCFFFINSVLVWQFLIALLHIRTFFKLCYYYIFDHIWCTVEAYIVGNSFYTLVVDNLEIMGWVWKFLKGHSKVFQRYTLELINLIKRAFFLKQRKCSIWYLKTYVYVFVYTKSEASILACKHFNKQNHNFQQHAEFALIEQIKTQTTPEETRTFLKTRRRFLGF